MTVRVLSPCCVCINSSSCCGLRSTHNPLWPLLSDQSSVSWPPSETPAQSALCLRRCACFHLFQVVSDKLGSVWSLSHCVQLQIYKTSNEDYTLDHVPVPGVTTLRALMFFMSLIYFSKWLSGPAKCFAFERCELACVLCDTWHYKMSCFFFFVLCRTREALSMQEHRVHESTLQSEMVPQRVRAGSAGIQGNFSRIFPVSLHIIHIPWSSHTHTRVHVLGVYSMSVSRLYALFQCKFIIKLTFIFQV